MQKIKVKRLSGLAEIPNYAHAGDACFDIKIIMDRHCNCPMVWRNGSFVGLQVGRGPDEEPVFTLKPCDTVVFHTGLSFELPEDHVMLIYARSSTGIKEGLMLSNGTGVIDSGYRGEVKVALTNTSCFPVMVRNGQRVAQGRITVAPQVDFEEVWDLEESERGENGIGSSGK